MTVSADKKGEIIERRMKVSQLRLSGFRHQNKIAEQLGVSKPTINRDFKALDEMYKERAASDIAIAKGIDLERLDELILAIWLQAKGGSIQAIDAVRALLTARAKLLGLDAPTQITGPGGEPIPHEVKHSFDFDGYTAAFGAIFGDPGGLPALTDDDSE